MDVNSALRACPICRKLSYYVIPSVLWYFSKEEKLEIIENYKSKLNVGARALPVSKLLERVTPKDSAIQMNEDNEQRFTLTRERGVGIGKRSERRPRWRTRMGPMWRREEEQQPSPL